MKDMNIHGVARIYINWRRKNNWVIWGKTQTPEGVENIGLCEKLVTENEQTHFPAPFPFRFHFRKNTLCSHTICWSHAKGQNWAGPTPLNMLYLREHDVYARPIGSGESSSVTRCVISSKSLTVHTRLEYEI